MEQSLIRKITKSRNICLKCRRQISTMSTSVKNLTDRYEPPYDRFLGLYEFLVGLELQLEEATNHLSYVLNADYKEGEKPYFES